MKEIRRNSRAKPISARRLRSLVRQPEKVELQHGAPLSNAHKIAHVDIEPYSDVLNNAPIGLFTLDRMGRICRANECGANFLGFPRDWLLGRPFVVFIAKTHIWRFLDFITDLARHPRKGVVEIDLVVSGRTQSVQLSIATSASSPILHQLIVVDVTDLKRTEQLLQESLSNWYSLVHNAPDTILTVDSIGRICFVNRPFWGYPAKALLGANLFDLLPDTEVKKVRQCLDDTFRYNKRVICDVSGVNGNEERWYQFSFGSPHGAESYAHDVFLTTTTTTTTTLIIREITETKHAEASLRTSGEHLRDFAARLEEVREEERTRVAREIHDELGQALTALKIDLSWLQGKSRRVTETRKKLKECIQHVDETIERVRRISSELRPSVLDNFGIVPAIDWQVSEFRKRTGIRTTFSSNTQNLDLSVDSTIAVFRVVQEALTNIMRHAQASRVQVSLAMNEDELRISVEDNGIGIARTSERDRKSFGIVGMKERISRIGGAFNCVSGTGKGTRIDIVVPVDP